MAKIAEAVIHIQLETIAKKLAAGYTDKEIMQALKIKERSYCYKKKKIYAIYEKKKPS
jgi:DNA-binding CsgD family transcriptional regulator